MRMNVANEQKGGIYIHVPFCVKKCDYCDFYSCTDLGKIPGTIDSLIDEMHLTADFPSHADTIYIGGGTPSLLKPKQIQSLIDAAVNRFQVAFDTEITIEANPGTVNAEKLAGFRQAGVNRINIGVQSFSDPALDFLTRIHTAEDAVSSFESARSAGFDNIGLDLIYGLPGQTEGMWRSDLSAAVNLNPEHLSCYMLTYEPGTPMGKNLQKGQFRPLPEKEVGFLYDFTVRFLEANGFYQYEVSNFSTSCRSRSKHNQKYWNHSPYIGLGPSAHSLIDNRRSWNVRSLDAYLKETGAGQLPIEETEVLNHRQLMMETLYLRFRCVDGILISDFENRFHIDFNKCFGAIVSRYESDGYLEMISNQCRLTRKGMLFVDSIASRFIYAI